MRDEDLLCSTPAGLWSKAGGFHIDPTRPVERALITHGHSDHARAGHGAVLATRETLRIMAARYGEDFAGTTQAATLGEAMRIGDATVTFQPAGHVLGSAQIVVEAGGTRIVASGDYKRRPDPTCLPFVPVPCDIFITEATFGLPVFRHPPAEAEIGKLLASVAQFPERAHLVGAYSLGKAQRVIRMLRDQGYDRTVYLHGSMDRLCRLYRIRGRRARPAGARHRRDRQERRLRRRGHHLPAVGDRRALGAALPRPGSGLRLGLDAHPPAREAGQCRTAADPLRPRRLGRTDRRPSPKLAPREVWVTHGREEALVRWCELQGIAGEAAPHGRLRGRGGVGRHGQRS